MPMGCAACGHAPYAHGCPDRSADHDYAQPSGELMATRLQVRRTGDRSLPCFESPDPRGPGRDDRPLSVPSSTAVAPVSADRGRDGPAECPPVPSASSRAGPGRRPAVPVSSPRRVPCRLRPARPARSALTRPPRFGTGTPPHAPPRANDRLRPAPRMLTPSPYRPPGPYGAPLHAPSPPHEAGPSTATNEQTGP